MTEANVSSSFFSMGLSTYKVPKKLFATNREKLRRKFAEANSESSAKEKQSQQQQRVICYIEGGNADTRNDSDHEPIFRQESFFHYLFGVKEPDFKGCIDLSTGHTILFMPRLPQEYAIVMGKVKQPDEFCVEYDVDEVKYTDEVEEYLMQLCFTEGGDREEVGLKILLLQGTNSDSSKEYKPPTFSNKKLAKYTDTAILFPILVECRVTKSSFELDLMRHCSEITSLAHVFTMKNTKPGMMEYQSESLFKHYAYYNFGSRHVGYTSICGCGPNGAVLHYGHAGAPNDRHIQDGDMCLMDMGAEYFCYGSDVTCSYPSNGKFTDIQKIVYEGVLNAQRSVYSMLKPGVCWLHCHKAAEEEIIKALIKLGVIVNGSTSVKDLVEMRLGATFMPHGLGHFIGIDTHDVGGYLPGHQQRMSQNGLRSLRTCRILEKDMVLTVEPGLYFIEHLVNEALGEKSNLKKYLNEEKVRSLLSFGGVRLEDVVAITKDGFENYTICPRTINEVEMVMSGGKWPPVTDVDPSLMRTRLTNTCTPLTTYV